MYRELTQRVIVVTTTGPILHFASYSPKGEGTKDRAQVESELCVQRADWKR